jgi:hypothetical protein
MKPILFSLFVAAAALLIAESAGGIRWTPPQAWKAQGARPMRAATYAVPAASGDKEDGECAVFYFGPGQGGGIDDNITRWIGQFEQPDGKPSRAAAKIARQPFNGVPVTLIDLTGTYTAMAGPMSPSRTMKPGYRLLGAIADSPQGAVFFKLTGPAKTVAGAEPSFQNLLKSITR